MPVPSKLAKTLEALGYEGDVEEFKVILMDTFAAMYRDRTIEEMLHRWWETRDYCKAVTRKAGLRGGRVADALIARTLTNMRKGSEMISR